MEDTLMASGSTISIESDLKMENSSDTNNDSDDENSDLEITFGPWPPFPSKQDTENPDDQMQVNLDSQDSSQLEEQYEEEHNFNMEADSDNVSLDGNSDIESAESYSKTDDITSQNIQVNEIELMDVIGPYELADKNENLELNSENTIVKANFESTEFIEDDESRIPTDTDTEEGNEIYHSDAETTDITDMNEPITNMTSLPTECDDVISNCVPSDGGVSPYTNDTLNSDVINKTQPQIEPDIVIKEEPKMDGYPDSSPSEIEEDDNLFVSTEHGRMFMRTVAAEHKDNEEKEIKETETESSTDKVQQTGSMLKSGRFNKKTTNPVPVYVVKKTKVSDQEADDQTNAELMPGRILGQGVSLETGTKEPTERDETQLVGQIQLPRTNGGKFKKISKTLINSSQKTNEIQEQEARKLTRKTISPALSSSSVSGDDTMPENQESYNLKARPADKEVVSLTNENSQLDLSLVKTEPEDYSEHNLDSKATDAGPHEADASSWIKKEPLTVDARQENTMEMNTPFPLKLIRNKGIDTFAPFSTIRKQVASTSKLPKTPASILLGGSPVTLQTGQKIWYTLPKGGHSTIQSEGNSNQTVKVIKLNNIDNTSSVVPLPGNLQLVRLQKTPTYTIPSSKGSEVPMVSVLKNKKLSFTRKASDNAEEDVQGNKNLILRKIDGIIKKNLELLNQDVQYPRSEEIDEETGNSMILIPKVKVTTQEKKVRKQTNKVIYRFDDRSKRSKKNKKGTVNSSTSVPLLSLLKITGTEAEKRPAMCDGFTQTKKDNPSTKKMVSGKAVMVKDFSIQTNISSENAETTGEDMPQETPENSSGAASTSLTEQVPANSEDTDLLMDVEDVDSLNIETRPLLDPLTVPRPSWKWTGRRTSSIGTNTGESSLDDDNSMNPLDHQYSVVPSKEKQRRQQNRVLAKERVRHKAEWLKLQKVKKSIRRQTYLKNKEWEYDCKLAMLKQKSEDRKKPSVDDLEIGKKALSIEKPDLLADVAVGQKKQEEKKAQMNDGPVEKVVDRRGEGNVEAADADSSGNANLTAAEPATRSSSRIKTRQSHALENSDMTRYFQRCKMKLGEVEDIGDVESTPYITDSSDEDWQEAVNQHVRRKLRQLRKALRDSDQSDSDNDSTLSEPENNDDDKTYTPEEEKRYIKVVKNPKLRRREKLYLDVKLEDHPDKWERKLFTSTLRQDRNIAVESKSYEEYRCLLCTGHHAFHTSAAELMESHLEEHLNSNFLCRECDATFDRQSLLAEHCKMVHSVTCEICNKEFTSRGLYKRHKGRMHGQRSISCSKCDEKFKNKLLYKQHLLEVHPGSAHKCDKCGVILRSHLNAMQGHMNSKNCLRRQQGNLKTQCEICGKLVSENGIRKHRQRVHQKLRIYKCDVCSYAGITLQSLKDHKKTHTGEHPVKCTLCDFSCIKPYQLKCHMRTHLKLKPYKCDQCSYAASWNVQVKDHMKAHFSPTRVDCTECNISFKDQRGLNLHRHKEHREGVEDDKAKESVPKKRGRPTRCAEREVKPKKNKREAKEKETEKEWPWSEEEYTDTEAELQNELSEEEKYIPRKSARRRVTKKLDPQFEHSSEEEDGHEQVDSYVPSVSKVAK